MSDEASRLRCDRWLLWLCVEAVVLLAILALSNMLVGIASPDTASYFLSAASANPWGELRNPLYGWVADLLGGSATGAGAVAITQAILHVASAFVLFLGARAGGIGGAGAFALATAALLSQAGLYHLCLLIPESLSISFLIAAFGLTIAASRSTAAWRTLIVPLVLVAGAGYLMRPSQLPALFLLPTLYWFFASRNRQDRRVARAAIMIAALALPFVVQSTIRLRAVGDFNVVSYGGFQMSAMAGFMLTPEIVVHFPENTRPLAQAILERREQAEATGRVARTPLNSTGRRSFVSAALGYFDIYARSYDDLLHGEIVRIRETGESWVDFNRRLMAFSIATVRTAPLEYAAWVGGATSRLVGRALVTNATMLVALILLLAAAIPALVNRNAVMFTDVGAIGAVALTWFACNGALAVLVTFPATRYIDTAAILLPAIPLAAAIAYFRR